MSSDAISTTNKQKKPRRGDGLRTEVWWSIPRYTELQDGESDGLDA
jgi:hypothetical protein